METKKRGRGRPKKTESLVSKPKGKRGRPKKSSFQQVYDISTNQVTKVEKEDAIIRELPQPANFIYTIHDATEKGRAFMEITGDSSLGLKKVQEYYLSNKSFREFVNTIINGAIQVKALRVAEELDSIV